ncbi:hypothetical protein [Pediococcus claussenii]|uniref:Membrane protein n=1 Tax=Pediococcus claussenii (strain ATCC BAA-344 / DSM 14800 / JCM 18046 / KCTC 3811 / LMG 21948 / P06) TaxID=701521 RepID=G8PAH1_PEDCP|nr:hypothetical protein [Pediococcus claussenii]AEV95760.1 putative membrane protein [Pediococcus claussenii ATCC BAA-344]ANZ69268.1 hypothetical protein AYR57_02655 [Pediococcus claussenii]ANZ71087.1 hypothetical protein AYR58_02670 [Pediococcus claussenii]KRN20371.1 hypothetical protein IV79_GL000424 [Pediococcus claussenii]
MNMKSLFKYGILGAIFIGILAITITDSDVTKQTSDILVSSVGMVIFLVLGILFTKSVRKNMK